jgi:hybrid cluster-associated redox disulfide protein
MTNPIDREMIIGEVLQMYPETQSVILKYFGSGCFSCPGMGMESLSFGAAMHNVDVEAMVADLNSAIEAGGDG